MGAGRGIGQVEDRMREPLKQGAFPNGGCRIDIMTRSGSGSLAGAIRRTAADAADGGARFCRLQRGNRLDVGLEVVKVLQDSLNIKGASARLDSGSRLLGALPELDSMAVVTVITTLEERFGFSVADDEIDGSVFATVGSLIEFVKSKLGI